MALPFNGDFLLLESSPGEQPEGKAASHLQSLIVFLVLRLTVRSVGVSFQVGTNTAQPPQTWGEPVGGLWPHGQHVAPHGEHTGQPP